MKVMLIEPAALYLDGIASNPGELWERLGWLRRLLRLNDARLLCSQELWEDVDSSDGLADPCIDEHWRYAEHWGELKNIAAQYLQRPMSEWQGQEDDLQAIGLRQQAHIYSDDSRWMTWKDLFAQCQSPNNPVEKIVSAEQALSCVIEGPYLTIRAEGPDPDPVLAVRAQGEEQG